jgi:hypothetical protein
MAQYGPPPMIDQTNVFVYNDRMNRSKPAASALPSMRQLQYLTALD